MIAFAPENDGRPWRGAAASSESASQHDTRDRADWVRLIDRINRVRFMHDLNRLADAAERIACAMEGRVGR